MNVASQAAGAVPCAHERMIFVTGASRSGTTLLSFILRRHSQVLGLPELQYFGEFTDPRRTESPWSHKTLLRAAEAIYSRHENGIRMAAFQTCDPEDISAYARNRAGVLLSALPPERRNPYGVFAAALEDLTRESGRTIACEQTPRNIFYAADLLEAYPEAKIVHMVRDPRAVMASQKKRWKRRRLLANPDALSRADALRAWVNYHPYTMATLWSRATAAAFRLRSHPRFLMIRFEDLLSHPRQTVQKVCDHVGLEFDPGMLEVPQINSSHASSASGTRIGLNPDAICAWRQSLNRAEIAITERLCREGMIHNGYEPMGVSSLTADLRYGPSYLAHAAGVFILNPKRAWIQLTAMMRAPEKAHLSAQDR
jgi:hypothetical protein